MQPSLKTSPQISWMVTMEKRTSGVATRDQDRKHLSDTCGSALLIDDEDPGEPEQVPGSVMKISKGAQWWHH